MGFNPLPILGGAAGFAFGGPSGAAIGAGIGGSLGGMFGGSENAPSISDVNLARDNPELFKELQKLQAMVGQFQMEYDRRRQGATAGELAGQAEARGSMNERLGNLGLVGSSAGARMAGAFEAQQQDALRNRIIQERQALMQQYMQAQQAYMSQFSNAQQGVLASQMGGYQGRQQDEQARNQFYSGIFNAGMNMYGSDKYLDAMKGRGMSYGTIPSIPASFGAGGNYGGYHL